MKKNKGFTLIELLAIIVILAIIAVITVPIILNVIDNSKKGAAKDSAYGYKDAINKYYVSELYENLDFKLDGTYTITDKGRLSNETGVHEIPFTGATPTGGYLKYENNILIDGCITMDEYKATVENGEITTVEKGSCEETQQVAYKCKRATELHTIERSGSLIEFGNLRTNDMDLVSGDAFDCDVDGDDDYGECTTVDGKTVCTERFYYVSDLYIGNNSETNEPEFDSNYAVLIYYNNTYNGEQNNTSSSIIAYDSSSKNHNGPVNAINNLPTIEQWSNISLSNTNRTILNEEGEGTTSDASYTYILPTTFSYTKADIDLAARLLTAQELETACGITVGSVGLDACNYLLENTKYSNSSLGTYGYWLETPDATATNGAWAVNSLYRSVRSTSVSNPGSIGARPVIEVLKSDIEL